MTTRRVGVVLLLALASLVNIGFAQDDPVSQTRIAKAKKTLVSDLEPGLPAVGLEQYLKAEVANATIEWDTNDCGKQTGDQATTVEDFPMCAQATVSSNGDNKAILMLAIGTLKTGMRGKPELFRMAVVSADGSEQPFSRLSEIASQLRTNPTKQPQLRPVKARTKKQQ